MTDGAEASQQECVPGRLFERERLRKAVDLIVGSRDDLVQASTILTDLYGPASAVVTRELAAAIRKVDWTVGVFKVRRGTVGPGESTHPHGNTGAESNDATDR